MNSQRVFYLMSALILLFVIAAIGGTYQINGLLQKKAIVLVNDKAKLVSLQNQQTELTQSKKDIAKYQSLYNISNQVVPQSKDQTEAVRQITQLAANNGINIQSITFPSSDLGNTGVVSQAAPPTPGAAVPVSSTNPNLSQLLKVPNISGVYELQLTVASSSKTGEEATFPELINYLKALENNRLTASVSSISIEPSVASSQSSQDQIPIQFSLVLDIFINPNGS